MSKGVWVIVFRCCICRLWYVVRSAQPDTSSWYNVVGSATTLCVSLDYIYYKNDTRTLQCQVNGNITIHTSSSRIVIQYMAYEV